MAFSWVMHRPKEYGARDPVIPPHAVAILLRHPALDLQPLEVRESLAGREALMIGADRAIEQQGKGVDCAHRRLRHRLGQLVEAHAMLVAQRGQADVQPLERLAVRGADDHRSEEHTSELQSLMRISYAVF